MSNRNRDAKLETIRYKVGDFCIVHGNELVTSYALRLCEELCNGEGLDATQGDADVWAASILFAAVKATRPFLVEELRVLTTKDVCRFFAVREKEIAHLASRLRRIYRIDPSEVVGTSPLPELPTPADSPVPPEEDKEEETVEDEIKIVGDEVVALSEEKKKRQRKQRQLDLFDSI